MATTEPDYAADNRPAKTKKPANLAPGPAKTGAVPKSIQQLSALDVRNTPTFYVWIVGSRAMCMAMAMQIEGCAAQCEDRMSRSKRSRFSRSVVSKTDARKALRRIHRAGERCMDAANDLARGWLDYMAYFEELRNPGKDGWDYRDEASTAAKTTAKG